MKTLLVHALNPEAKLIKQKFDGISRSTAAPGVDLYELNDNYDIIRTGIGLPNTEAVLEQLPEPMIYDSFFQFGVSGSLSDDVPVHSKVSAHTFSALNKNPITVDPNQILDLFDITPVGFYSSIEVVSDEDTRQVAISHGAQAVDMESYAVAEYCARHDVPLKTLRIISDRAGESTPDEFRQNFKKAAELLQRFIIKNILQA